MDRRIPTERPTVALLAHESVSDDAIAHVLFGAEEEGVPIKVQRGEDVSAFALAHQAASQSQLDVGIGLCGHMAVITTRQLPQQMPYLITGFGVDTNADRLIGANAARIVKRTPLHLSYFISIHDLLRSAQHELETSL